MYRRNVDIYAVVKDGAEDYWTKSTALESIAGATFKALIVEHMVGLQYRDYGVVVGQRLSALDAMFNFTHLLFKNEGLDPILQTRSGGICCQGSFHS